MKKNYDELQEIMRASSGTSQYHRVMFAKSFVVTDGMKYFVDEAGAYWLFDVVASYIPKIKKIKDYFFVVKLVVNEKQEGKFEICHEVRKESEKLVKQKVPFVDLPAGEYEFFLFNEDDFFYNDMSERILEMFRA